MNRAIFFFLFIVGLDQGANAAIVRIADGDCAALSAAAASVPGSEPSLIVLATKGHYAYCPLVVSGTVKVDGAGATIGLRVTSGELTNLTSQIEVQYGATLHLRNVNLGAVAVSNAAQPRAQASAVRPPVNPSLIFGTSSAINNAGNLTLDMASLSGVDYHGSTRAFPMIFNSGTLTLRNVSMANNAGDVELIFNGGSLEISHSSFVSNSSQRGLLSSQAGAAIAVANSLFADAGSAACAVATAESPQGQVISLGGNITTENSCGFSAAGDRVVADAGLGSFGDNGGLVNTVLLTGNSPAVRNGVAANCEASDARGVVRNVQVRGTCDSGAYEFGGGRGLLSQGGKSGFFYDASADGHYVTVQRLDWGSTLVIWNTFDKNGQAAWIYAIGEASSNHIHAQGAQNLGGVLQPGGAPTGSHGVVWGDIDIDLQNCFGGTFSYNSPLPNFGSGQFPLNRLAFLGDLDCSD
jgi:hypothetical protein